MSDTPASAAASSPLRSLTVAVLGSTGAIGRQAVRHALAHPEVAKVVAVVRKARTDMGQGVADPKLVEQVVDFDHLTAETFLGVDLVLCCLGSTIKAAGSQEEFKKQDHDLILRCGEKAKEAGVRHFSLVSSVGASSSAGNFYLKTKGQIEDGLRALHFARLSIFKPSVLDAPRDPFRCGECCGLCMVKYTCGPCIWCCCRQYGSIHVSDVALAMVSEGLATRPPADEVTVFDGSGAIGDYLQQFVSV